MMKMQIKGFIESLPSLLFWLVVALALLLTLPAYARETKSGVIIVLGLVGIWRYSWWLINIIRGVIFRFVRFPQLRRRCDALDLPNPQRLFVMVMSYREDPAISEQVFTALTNELLTLDSEIHVVVSVGSGEEAANIEKMVSAVPGSDGIDFHFMLQSQGKRVAMGHGLRHIARLYNDPQRWSMFSSQDLVIFMDGDSLLTQGAISRCTGFFKLDRKLGALTTHEDAVVQSGSVLTTEWYKLRFARRHSMMKSHALSGKVLTLTGRYSMFRASIVLSEAFIRGVEADHLHHWLFGKFRFLMGDDKSTWYHLLRDGWKMLYVPDVLIYSMESRAESFFKLSIPLVFRWNGNMLRNNARALALGPSVTGHFIWYAILDQRISMWTTFIGLLSTGLLAITKSWVYLVYYAIWVIVTRTVQLLALVFQGKSLTVVDLPLQVFDQWVGSAVKIYASYHLNQQSWSKAKSVTRTAISSTTRINRQRIFSRAIMLLHICAFLLLLALGTGVIHVPHLSTLAMH